MRPLSLFFCASTFLLTACGGDPEEAARSALSDVQASWEAAQETLDPQARLDAYNDVIATVENVAETYPETEAGEAIAAGRSVDGIAIATMKAERDKLAERADCYANPTADCLRAYANRRARSGGNSATRDTINDAQTAICETGFADADAALEDLKINRANYAQQLVQLGMAAAECDRPDDVRAAIDAYLAAEPAQGPQRVNALGRILNTPDLAPAWAPVMADLETVLDSGQMDNNSAANAAITLAAAQARSGNADAALEKIAYVTDTLGFGIAGPTQKDMAIALVAGGNPAAGRTLYDDQSAAINWGMILRDAASELGAKLGLTKSPPSSGPELMNVDNIDDYFAPVAESVKAEIAPRVAAIEEAVNQFIPDISILSTSNQYSNADSATATLALIQQKLGAPDKASELVDKAAAMRMQRFGDRPASGVNYIAPFQTLIAIGQGRYDDAARTAQDIGNSRGANRDYVRLIVTAIAKTGDAERALSVANQAGQGGGFEQEIVDALISSGHTDKAIEVINASNISGRQQSELYWRIVAHEIGSGGADSAAQSAEGFGLLNTSEDELRLLDLQVRHHAEAEDQAAAEEALRAYFAVGEEMDLAGARDLYAQQAAELAFEFGFFDLGVVLYRAASRKDHRPVREALRDGPDREQYPTLLMLAHDHAEGNLPDVIDVAIGGLE